MELPKNKQTNLDFSESVSHFPKVTYYGEYNKRKIDGFSTSCKCDSLLSTIKALRGHKETKTWPLISWSLCHILLGNMKSWTNTFTGPNMKRHVPSHPHTDQNLKNKHSIKTQNLSICKNSRFLIAKF